MTTFEKRQKEIKQLEKRKLKEQKRAQRKMEKMARKESSGAVSPADTERAINDWHHKEV
jgi:hypothetical protein